MSESADNGGAGVKSARWEQVFMEKRADIDGAEPERLLVSSGEQAGACLHIDGRQALSIGNALENDVVIRTPGAEPVKLQLEGATGQRRIRLVQGEAALAGRPLLPDEQWHEWTGGVLTVGGIEILLEGASKAEQNNSSGLMEPDSASHPAARRSVGIVAVLVGLAVLTALGIQGRWQVDASEQRPNNTFEQQMAALDLGDSLVLEGDGDPRRLLGRVATHAQYRELQAVVAAQAVPPEMQVQVDDELRESIRDIYRNHGVSAQVAVLGQGHVQVDTQGVSDETLIEIEQALQEDIPGLQKLDVSNSPAAQEDDAAGTARALDPKKEVEAVVAGSISYVMTRDKARYFVGAVLPSGHTITAIEQGLVVMQRDGEESRLRF